MIILVMLLFGSNLENMYSLTKYIFLDQTKILLYYYNIKQIIFIHINIKQSLCIYIFSYFKGYIYF